MDRIAWVAFEKHREDLKLAYPLKTYINPRVQGAMIAASIKRMKREIAIEHLKRVAMEKGADLTPTLAKKILSRWLGRSVSWNELLDTFGLPDRTAETKSKDFQRMDELSSFGEEGVYDSIRTALDASIELRSELRERLKVDSTDQKDP